MNEDKKIRISEYELILIVVVFLWGTNYPIVEIGISRFGVFLRFGCEKINWKSNLGGVY